MKRNYFSILVIALISMPAIAVAYPSYGAGRVATNLMEPVSILTNFIGTMSIVVGISFLLASFLKYLQFKVNPLASPISTVIMLLIMGIVLVCLPLVYKLTSSGIPITL